MWKTLQNRNTSRMLQSIQHVFIAYYELGTCGGAGRQYSKCGPRPSSPQTVYHWTAIRSWECVFQKTLTKTLTE